MSDGAQLLELAIDVSQREVLRYLGYPRRREPTPRVQQRMQELWPEALALLRPRGTCRVVQHADVAAAKMPEPTELVGIGLCTIGPALESEAQRRSADGAVLDGLLLDAFGSAAAEAAAESLDQQLCMAAVERGCHTRARISPGYGRWPVDAQRGLLALLPAAELGVQLTAGLMMVPRKSVSFALRFHDGRQLVPRRRRRCASCERDPCAHREDDEGGDQGRDEPERAGAGDGQPTAERSPHR